MGLPFERGSPARPVRRPAHAPARPCRIPGSHWGPRSPPGSWSPPRRPSISSRSSRRSTASRRTWPLSPWASIAAARATTREHAPEVPANKLFADSPDLEGEMNVFRLRQAVMGHVLLWGNGYLEIVRDGRGPPIGLYPLNPARTQPKRDDWTGKLYYLLLDNRRKILPENILHVAGLGFDGIAGLLGDPHVPPGRGPGHRDRGVRGRILRQWSHPLRDAEDPQEAHPDRPAEPPRGGLPSPPGRRRTRTI